MSGRAPLSIPQRVAAWDAALTAVRRVLREQGLREVVTPLRLAAVAIEPFIEPLAAPPGLLATSPELPMKRLLCRGAPSIFQITPCFRAAEHGDLHREEFHMIEWYRRGADTPAVRRDVERVVEAVFEAVGVVLEEPPAPAPSSWREVPALPLMSETLGAALSGDEDATALRERTRAVSARLGDPLASVPHARLAPTPRAHALAAWTALFSAWCDVVLDPWLSHQREHGIHLVELPPALAALSEVAPSSHEPGRMVAHRFESYVHGCELANGYRELRDPGEQRSRFEAVNALRVAVEQPTLPVDEAFLDDLRAGLPQCAGVALGLDRLVLLATGRARIGDVAIELGAVPR